MPKEIAEQRTAIKALADQIEELKREVREAESRTGMLVPPTPPKSGLNLNRRSQVLRMSRQGERPSKIAAALSLPQKEVELLVKVQKIVLSSADVPTS